MDTRLVIIFVLCGHFVFAECKKDNDANETLDNTGPIEATSDVGGCARVLRAINFLATNAKDDSSFGGIDYIERPIEYSKFYLEYNSKGVVDMAVVESIFLYATKQASEEQDTVLERKFGVKVMELIVKQRIQNRKNSNTIKDQKTTKDQESFLKSIAHLNTIRKFDKDQDTYTLFNVLRRKIQAVTLNRGELNMSKEDSFVIENTVYGVYHLNDKSGEIQCFSLSFNKNHKTKNRQVSVDLHNGKLSGIKTSLMQKHIDAAFFKSLPDDGKDETSKLKHVIQAIEFVRKTRKAKPCVNTSNFDFVGPAFAAVRDDKILDMDIILSLILFHSLDGEYKLGDRELEKTTKVYSELLNVWDKNSLDKNFKRLHPTTTKLKDGLQISPATMVASLSYLVHNLITICASEDYAKEAKLEFVQYAQVLQETYRKERYDSTRAANWKTENKLRLAYQALTDRLTQLIQQHKIL